MSKKILAVIIILGAAAVAAVFLFDGVGLNAKKIMNSLPIASNEPTPMPTPTVSAKFVLHDVPFTPQAPFAEWDDQRQQDGCEESTALMAIRWAQGRSLTLHEARAEIINASDFELEKYGEFRDTSSKDTIDSVLGNPARELNGSPQTILCQGPPQASRVNVAEPDYCTSGPAATVTWRYDGGSNQAAYQVQIDDNLRFGSPEADSGKVDSSSNSYFTGLGKLVFGKTYNTRVRVWDTENNQSDWVTAASFTTPPHAYPGVDFTWAPTTIKLGEPVVFTDKTQFGANPATWLWRFGDGNTSDKQNPVHTYADSGKYTIKLTATDISGFTCSAISKTETGKELPIFIEVLPR